MLIKERKGKKNKGSMVGGKERTFVALRIVKIKGKRNSERQSMHNSLGKIVPEI